MSLLVNDRVETTLIPIARGWVRLTIVCLSNGWPTRGKKSITFTWPLAVLYVSPVIYPLYFWVSDLFFLPFSVVLRTRGTMHLSQRFCVQSIKHSVGHIVSTSTILTIASLSYGDSGPSDVETKMENDLSGIPNAGLLVHGGIGIQAVF